MKIIIVKAALWVSAVLFAAVPTTVAQDAVATPSPTVALKAITYKGCYKSGNPLTDQGPYTFQSTGWCQKVCAVVNKPIMGLTKGSNCWCGDEFPDDSNKVSDSECNTPCDGYNQQDCGGESTFSVYLDGLSDNVGFSGGSSSSASSSDSTSSRTKTAAPSVITEAGQTIVVTASGDSLASTKSNGPSKTSIAAGVIVGVVVLCVLCGALFFFLRARKRKAVEEAYRRNAAINSFVSVGGRHTSSEGSDSRLDPSIMVQRRQSDGSIADNQDYSRRILRVANPDHRN